MSEPSRDDDLLRPEASQEIPNDEELLRELEHDELCKEISKQIARFN